MLFEASEIRSQCVALAVGRLLTDDDFTCGVDAMAEPELVVNPLSHSRRVT
jgi:hypothetical protein